MTKKTIHGIDPYAPGGIQALLEFHRGFWGDARMAEEGGEQNAGEQQEAPKPGPQTQGSKESANEEPNAAGSKQSVLDDLAKERKTRQALEARVAELEDATKTEEQKRAEQFEALQKSEVEKAAQLTAKDQMLLAYQVAASKGLDLDAAERLRGSTREELEADADKWVSKWGTAHRPGFVPGAGGASGGGQTDPGSGVARLRHAYNESSKK